MFPLGKSWLYSMSNIILPKISTIANYPLTIFKCTCTPTGNRYGCMQEYPLKYTTVSFSLKHTLALMIMYLNSKMQLLYNTSPVNNVWVPLLVLSQYGNRPVWWFKLNVVDYQSLWQFNNIMLSYCIPLGTAGTVVTALWTQSHCYSQSSTVGKGNTRGGGGSDKDIEREIRK